MSRNTSSGDSRRRGNGNGSYWSTAAAMGGAAAVVGGLAYWFSRPQSGESRERTSQNSSTAQGPQVPAQPRPSASSASASRAFDRNGEEGAKSQGSLSDYLSRLLQIAPGSPSTGLSMFSSAERRMAANPVVSNLNGLLQDIYQRYIAIKDDELEHHYNVFNEIFFNHLHKSMKEVDAYYRKYSSTVQFAGSHYDRLRIKKPDEFDMDIVIGLPVNIRENPGNPEESDIVIQATAAGFVQLKMGVQFKSLYKRDGGEWLNNRAAFEWMDEKGFLLRSKFINWFKGVVDRALNMHRQTSTGPALFIVRGRRYTVEKSESGPAVTLYLKDKATGFQCDVDLVPALKFPEKRWPISSSYRSIPYNCKKDYWMVVPKPNKAGQNVHDENRSWRIALHNQERELMHGTCNLRQAIRLMKKLRDSQGMNKIASYYVKTLFFWEIVKRNDPDYWRSNSPATIFTMMLGNFQAALETRKIPYFWNKNNNLIANVDGGLLSSYASKIATVRRVLDVPSEYRQIARYLLTTDEYLEYNTRFLRI